MTAKECRGGLGTGKEFFIKSRFGCARERVSRKWVQNTRPVGASTFGLLAIGTIAKGSRTMNVHYRYVGMETTGETGVATFMITPDVTIPQKWPATAATQTGGSLPAAQSFAARRTPSHRSARHGRLQLQGPFRLPLRARRPALSGRTHRCLECRNAFVLPSNLPQLPLFSDHLDRLQLKLPPQQFHALWGQSRVNVTEAINARTDTEIAHARRQIEDGTATSLLPLSAQVEFDA